MLAAPRKVVEGALKGLASRIHIEKVVDGFRNLVTGVGTGRAKTSYGEYVPDAILDFWTLEGLFESNDLAAVIVSKIVEDALRAPFDLKTHDGSPKDDRDEVEKVLAKWRELACTDRVVEGAIFGRLKGCAGVILGVTGGGALTTPLVDKSVKEIATLIPWDAEDMSEYAWYANGDCELYLWQPPAKGGPTPAPMVVHETRLLKFPGSLTTARGRRRNRGWDHSVLQRVYSALRSFDGMFGSTDAMFADASQRVFKLQGLIQALAEADGTGAADVQTRLQMMDLHASALKAIMLDAGDETGQGQEEYSVVERTTLGTLDGVMNVYLIRLAAAARMPLTVLLGMSPAGMDATGESDMILWYNTVDIYRRRVLEPRMLRLLRMVAQTVGVDASQWEIVWPELARPKPIDVATAEQMNVAAAASLIEAQVLVPEEVALNLRPLARLGISGLVIDVAARKKRLTDALKELEDGELGDEIGVEEPAKMGERKTPAKAAKRQT